jgi:hypothetical protein
MNFSLKRNFIRFNDNLLEVIRYFRKYRINDIEAVKQYYNCTVVLQKNGFMYFCIEIPEAEVIEDVISHPDELPMSENLLE